MSGLTLQAMGTTLSRSRCHSLLHKPGQDVRRQVAMRCAPQLHRGYAPLPTSIRSSRCQQGSPDSTALPPQLSPCCRNLDGIINRKYKSTKQHALMNTEMEETKSRCGGRASGDVIAKSTKARTPEILSSKDDKDRLRLIFHAAKVLSVICMMKEVLSYRYE